MKPKRTLAGLVAVSLLAFTPSLLAQAGLPIYTDNLVNDFQDWSWIPHNMANTSPVHSGQYSISASANTNDGEGLQFGQSLYNQYQGGFDCTPYLDVMFWANGGPTGGQVLIVYATYGTNRTWSNGRALWPLWTNSWLQYTIPLSVLLPAGISNVNGFIIELSPNGPTNTFYVDDISLFPRPAPALQHISVNAVETLRAADPRWFGANAGVWDEFFDTAATSNALSAAGILSMRFPGGSLSDQYNWATGLTGTWSNGVLLYSTSYPTTFSNFMHIATNLGLRAFITVNYGTGTSNEAAAWVLNANVTNHCGFKCWEVGNEVYGAWEQDNNNPPNDPYTYAVRFAGYQALMKAADPSIEVGAVSTPGEDSYNTYTNHPATNSATRQVHCGWTPVMLATLKSLGVTPDFLVYHFYPEYTPYDNPAPDDDSDPLVLQVSSQVAGDATNLRSMINNYFGAGGSNIELVCTENNADAGYEGRQSTSLVNAVFLADTLAQFMKTEFNAYTFWQLRSGAGTAGNFDPTLYGWRDVGDEGLIEGLDDGLESGYPDYFAMQLMQYFVRPGDTVLLASSDYSLLPAYAARGADGSLRLLVINKDTTTNFTAQIRLSSFVPSPSGALVYSYGIPQDDATEQDLDFALQEIAVTNFPPASTLFTNSFPPLSLTLFKFAPATPSLSVRPADAGQLALQLSGQWGAPYVIQTSTDLVNWTSISTNRLNIGYLNLPPFLAPGTNSQYWRAMWQPY
jgi:hypothetical protein